MVLDFILGKGFIIFLPQSSFLIWASLWYNSYNDYGIIDEALAEVIILVIGLGEILSHLNDWYMHIYQQ